MKRLVVLGAGTAGTMVVNKLSARLDADEWKITVVDQAKSHVYQPGFLFLPFGGYEPEEIVKPKQRFIPDGVEVVWGEIDKVDAEGNSVVMTDGTVLGYDQLVIATGTTPRPDETPGMAGDEWRKSVHEFYTYEGARHS
ncbi:MAG: FAD-dependent oxidoreductase, partial [Acidimicrobiia bacterium]|nr:FAD-dependent oxidoreductase [Acidimicrobiia bacterium]